MYFLHEYYFSQLKITYDHKCTEQSGTSRNHLINMHRSDLNVPHLRQTPFCYHLQFLLNKLVFMTFSILMSMFLAYTFVRRRIHSGIVSAAAPRKRV